MTREELDEVLRLHALWLAGEAGIRAHCEAYNMSILAIHSLEVEE